MPALSAFDLLTLSPEEQDVVRCLTSAPPLSSSEIAARTARPLEQIEALLGQMERNGQITALEADGQPLFALQLRRTTTHVRGRSLLNFSGEAV